MGKKNILKDLAIGSQGEKRLILLLNEVEIISQVQPTKGKFSDYDIESSYGGHNFTLEVKNDVYAIRSGNVAIEVFNPKSGRASGLMISKSDLWVHITDGVYVANTELLKKWVNDNPASRVITHAGDGNATIYLYPIDTIFDGTLFVRIDNIGADLRRNSVIQQLSLKDNLI